MRKAVVTSGLLFLSILSLGGGGWGFEQGMWAARIPKEQDHLERFLALLDSDRVKTCLGLTNPQVERLRQIIVETEKADVKVLADIEVRRIELRENLRADKPDRDSILKQVQEISDLRGEIMKHKVEAILSAKTVLSPEQQKKMFSLFESLNEGGLGGDRRGSVDATKGDLPPEVPFHPGEPPVE